MVAMISPQNELVRRFIVALQPYYDNQLRLFTGRKWLRIYHGTSKADGETIAGIERATGLIYAPDRAGKYNRDWLHYHSGSILDWQTCINSDGSIKRRQRPHGVPLVKRDGATRKKR